MLGFNGGLLGVRRTPTNEVAAGLWFQNEQSVARRAAIWPGSDPFWNNVSLLLQMQGTNGSATFTDSSSNGLTATVVGNAQISTAQFKWGASSGLFDGAGDRILFTLATAIGTSDFCLEAWVYFVSRPAAATLFAVGDQAGSTGLIFYSTAAGRTGIYSAGQINTTGTSQTIPTGAWCHVALTRANSDIRMFVDGVQDGNGTHSGSLTADVYLGQALDNGVFTSAFNGYIGAARITAGEARYTANFTPPTAAFPTS